MMIGKKTPISIRRAVKETTQQFIAVMEPEDVEHVRKSIQDL
jgi:hypothetical protein